MIRISEIKIALSDDCAASVLQSAAGRLSVRETEITKINIIKKAVDARKKSAVHFVYTVDVALNIDEDALLSILQDKHICPAPSTAYTPPGLSASTRTAARPVVCGMGPAGLFAGLVLAKAGLRPIIIERGGNVDSRIKSVNTFWESGILDTVCNVQFGEGGAGTFSDGKLTTNINDIRCRFVLDELIRHGAPPEIGYLSKPHIGTDMLRSVVKNMRRTILSLGGQIRFHTLLEDMIQKDGKITGVLLRNAAMTEEVLCDRLVMAVGHSARDTFDMLHRQGAAMKSKPFAIGVRIEHPQKWLDTRQYGSFAGHPALGAADYKLAAHLPSGRSVYTFCMCPGGMVVAAASEEGGIVTNGMSNYARDGINANSALLCEVAPSDFGSDSPLAGVEFQRKWEKSAFLAGGQDYRAPAQRIEDFLKDRVSARWGEVIPSYRPGTVFGDLSQCLPAYVTDSLKAGIVAFDKRLSGFASPDAVLTGVETRSSSPVRILRTDALQSNIEGLYPCGEGAGYAGGIMSAAADGIKVAEAVIASLNPV